MDANIPGIAPGQEAAADHPIDGPSYGPMKAQAEAVLRAAMPDRHLIVRPGLIVGPHDKYTRFTYWVARAGAGGRMAVPGRPEEQGQFIDARDLGAFMVQLLERGIADTTVQATGPAIRLTHGQMIAAMGDGLSQAAEPVWIDPGRAAAAGIELPIPMRTWLSAAGDFAHLHKMDISRALSLGLTTRPVGSTIDDIRQWLADTGSDADVATLRPIEQRLLTLAEEAG